MRVLISALAASTVVATSLPPKQPLTRGWVRQLGPVGASDVHVATDGRFGHAVVMAHITPTATAAISSPAERRRRLAEGAWWNPFAGSSGKDGNAPSPLAALFVDDPPVEEQVGGAYMAWVGPGGGVVRELRFGDASARIAGAAFAGRNAKRGSHIRPLYIGSTVARAAMLQRWNLEKTPPVVWSRALFPSSADLESSVTVVAASSRRNAVIVAGRSSGVHPLPGQLSLGGGDGFWALVNVTDGSLLFTCQFGTASLDEPTAIAVSGRAGQQRTYIAGWTFGETDFAGAGAQHPAGTRDAAVWIFDHKGRELWAERFGTPSDDAANAIAVVVDADGADVAFVVGRTGGRLPLTGSTSATSTVAAADFVAGGAGVAPRQDDGFLCKIQLHKGETVQWVRQFGTPRKDVATGVAVGWEGNIVVVGTTEGDFFGSGPSTEPTMQQHQPRGFAIVFDHTGAELLRVELKSPPSSGGLNVAGSAALRSGLIVGGIGAAVGGQGTGSLFAARFDVPQFVDDEENQPMEMQAPPLKIVKHKGGAVMKKLKPKDSKKKKVQEARKEAKFNRTAASKSRLPAPHANKTKMKTKTQRKTKKKKKPNAKGPASRNATQGGALRRRKQKRRKARVKRAASAAMTMAERLTKLEAQLAAVDSGDQMKGSPSKRSRSSSGIVSPPAASSMGGIFADQEKRAANKAKKTRQKLFLWPEVRTRMRSCICISACF